MVVKNNIFGTLSTLFEFGKTNQRVTIFTGVGEGPKETVGTTGDFYIQADPTDPGIWQKRVDGWARFARIDEVGPGFYGITVGQTDDLGTFSGINKINFDPDSFYITQNDPNTDEVIVSFRGEDPDNFSYHEVFETITIPFHQQMSVFGGIVIEDELVIESQLVLES